MHKTLFVILLAMLTFQKGNSQTTLGNVVYYMKNSGLATTSRDSADYIRVYMPKNDKTELYPVLEYYKNGTRKLIGSSYTQSSKLILEGQATSFFANGRKQTASTYTNGYATGDIYSFFPNGKLYFYETHSTVKSKPKLLLMECRDSTGKVLTENGNGTWIAYDDDDFKTIAAQGQVVNGLKEGEWHGATAQVAKYTCTYKNGETVTGVGYDKQGTAHPFTKEFVDADFKGGMKKFYDYINRNARYPLTDRQNGVTGRVEAAFYVETDGRLTGIAILKGLSNEIDEAVYKAIAKSPAWTPALQFGVPKRADFTVTTDYDESVKIYRLLQ